MSVLLDWSRWVVVLSTLALVALTVAVHYSVLLRCAKLLPSLTVRRPPRVMILIFMVLLAHVFEIWLFALAYQALAPFGHFGFIAGNPEPSSIVDYVYFSSTVYSTVGFGDLAPVGPLRVMVGMEAVTGLVMIAWSASFTYIEMQRDWPSEPVQGVGIDRR
jgi:hypothetical protein